MSTKAWPMQLTAADKAALREFWRFYEPRRASSAAHVIGDVRQLEHQAVVQDDWGPYLTSVRARGVQYAEAGVSYPEWFGLVRAHQQELEKQLLHELEGSASALLVATGLSLFFFIAVKCLGEAYFDAKQQLVAQSDARYRAMFDQSPLPMWMFDRATLQFVTVNDAAIRHYGYTRDEFMRMTLADIRSAEDLAELRADVEAAQGIGVAKTWQHRKKDGTTIAVEIRANDFDLDGRAVRLVLITDITERLKATLALRKTQDQLRHAQKMEAIGRLAGGVAHDFNNILTVVQSYACLLEENIAPSDARHEDAAEIRRACGRAQEITRQLLAMSRNSVVTPQAIDLDELVAGFVPMLRRLLGGTIALVTHRGGVPKVLADAGQMEQVLMNLAANARDAMPSGGRLTIETRTAELDVDTARDRHLAPGRYVELAVTDTGTGIDAETQGRIFDPFFTTKEPAKGTGLGLAIVYGIVTQAGGSISVYSEKGHGTTFRVYLPVTETEPAPVVRDIVAAPRTLPPMRVLIVDDQVAVRAVSVRILREAGCQVIEAATAEEARRICVSDDEKIDLVLLDVVLPDERGDLLAQHLRHLRPELKLLQMSGYPAHALTASEPRAEHVLSKPFSPSELRGAIARVCGLSGGTARTADAGAEPRHPRRALVADDDESFLRTVQRILRKADFAVTAVDSGFKAISALEETPFDVVLSDVQMPDGGGLDLLRAIRRIDLDVPVILMTGEPSLTAAAQAVEYGAFRYLTKPIDHASFTKLVEHAARTHALARLRREALVSSGMHAGVADRAGLEVRFEEALDRLWMAYQPMVHARTGMLFGVEALLRTDEESLPTPPALLHAAELLGRLPVLGRKVRTLCAESVVDRPELTLFVNLHPHDLQDDNLVDRCAALSAVAPRIILEVTERASLDVTCKLVERIARLRELGFRIAVDDIGAGYSGLSSFTELTPEVVKIDMSLVRDVHTSRVKQHTIRALCRLCHDVDTLVVGEGVETVDERDALVSLGCDLLQGYLIGKPNRVLPR